MDCRYSYRVLLVALSLLTTSTFSMAAQEPAARFVLGQSLTVEANEVVQTAVVVGGDLAVNGTVEGLALCIGGDLKAGPTAQLRGGAVAIGGQLQTHETARVQGPRVQVAGGDFEQVLEDVAEASGRKPEPFPLWAGPLLRLLQLLALLMLAIPLVLLFPRSVQNVRNTLVRDPGRCALAGVVVLLGFGPLCLLLALSLVGIPLIAVMIVLLLAGFVLGLSALSVALGFRTAAIRKPDNLVGALALGLLLLALVAGVPILGGLVLFAASFYGAGAVVLSRFGSRPPAPPPTDDSALAGDPAMSAS